MQGKNKKVVAVTNEGSSMPRRSLRTSLPPSPWQQSSFEGNSAFLANEKNEKLSKFHKYFSTYFRSFGLKSVLILCRLVHLMIMCSLRSKTF